MKLFQQFLIAVFLFSLLSFSSLQAHEAIQKMNPNNCYECKYKPVLSETSHFVNKYKGDQTLVDGNFVIFDSLSNAFSYFSEDQQPYLYDRETGTLITIIRGYFNTTYAKHSNYTGFFTSNNLFVRTSTDWGNTWSASDIIYNSGTPKFKDKWARYPSVYPYYVADEETMGFAFTAPITTPSATGSWEDGFVTGLYYGTTVGTIVKSAVVNGETVKWYGSSSKMVTYVNPDGEGTGLALGLLNTGNPGGFNHFGLRKSEDFENWETVIPSQWASNKFVPADPDTVRNSSIVDLKKAQDGKLYMATFAVFNANDITDRASVGVSVSEDKGETWTEFNILPFTLVRDYAEAQGANPDSVAFNANCDFTLLDNGDYSFAMYLREYNDSREFDSLNIMQIVEVYWENNAWGIRKVADLTGLWVPYYDEDNDTQASMSNNQLRNEIQITRTLDGTTLVIKWVDLIGVAHNWGESTFTWQTSDIFSSGRTVGTSNWTEAKNLTNTIEVDRVTWIPDFIPDDLTLPILKVKTMAIEGETSDEARFRQMHNQGEEYEQHVMLGHFAPVSVNEQNSAIVNKVDISGIYPNPASEKANIDFTLTASGNITIDIYNVFGQLVANVYDNFINDGFNSININTKDLPTGAYFITLRTANESVTKQLNVIR